jgi:hypothetical protein
LHYVLEDSDMNMKKEMFLGVIFLVTAIFFVSSTPVINHAFAKSHDSQAQDDSGSKQAQDDSGSKQAQDDSGSKQAQDDSGSKQAQDDSGSKNYENFLNCLSGASGSNSYPAGDQIVNCFAESGYIQGSSSASNTADSQDKTGNVDVNALHDDKSDKSSSDSKSDKSSSNDNVKSSSNDNVKSSSDSKSDKSSSNDNADSSSNDNADSSSNDNADSSSNDNADSSSNNSFIDSAYEDGN